MKKWLGRFSNFMLVCLLIFLVYKKGPELIDHIKSEGNPAARIQVPLLYGGVFDSDQIQTPIMVVFWATWCLPCDIELSRINKMILDKKIKPEAVLAISVQEKNSTVEKIARDRNYQFLIGLDTDGRVSAEFKVVGTPTVLFIGKDKLVAWKTTGLSPTLEFRAARFLD